MNRLKTTFGSQFLILLFACCPLLFSIATVVDAKIVFCVDDDLYVMNDDGSHRRRITKNTQAVDRYPRWSPDGTKIAFTRYMDKTQMQTSSELFIINADGTEPQQLTHNDLADGSPAWSPDGHHLAFTSSRSGKWDVFVIELASQTVTQLTGIEDGMGSAEPDWSPDGTQITFERFIRVRAGLLPKTIYVMSATGEHQRPILPDPPIEDILILRFRPRWSTDGQRILFCEHKWRGEKRESQFIVQGIGSRKKEITDINDRLGNNWLAAGKCWTENDHAILVSLMRKDKPNPNYDIYRYTFDTRGLRRLTRDPTDERYPDWIQGTLSVSPHGKLTQIWAEIKQIERQDQF